MNITKILNNSKLFLGLMMVLNIIGNKYIIHDITKTFEHILKKPITRMIFFFCSLFIVVRDVKISLCLTIIAVIIYKKVVKEQFKDIKKIVK